jgi:hypothetical protein
MSEASSSKKAKTSTPYDIYFEELKAFVKANSLVGEVVIKGLEDIVEDDDDDDDDEDDPDTSKYTAEQLENLRFIMLTKEREEAMKRYSLKLLGGQGGQGMMMFDTSFSYVVFDEHFCFESDFKKEKNLAKKFNMLFAFTYTVKTYDVWLHDNEDGEAMLGMIDGLAESWKELLKKTDEELCIDTEYTRPGVIAFLEQFEELVKTNEDANGFDFQ